MTPTHSAPPNLRPVLSLAADLVGKSEAAPEQALRMLTADVGQTESEVVHREHKLAVHHYEPDEVEHATPIFVVYALVNRPYILDLQPDRSVVRSLLSAGFEVYLVDWGEPSRLDTELSLADYICRYLDNAAEAVCDHADVEDLHVLGYCMGGTLALIYTALDDAKVRTLSLMATPIAFDGTGGILERWAMHYDPELAADTLGNIPGELLAVEFAMMDPVDNFLTKYVRLYENLEDDDFVENFARMERWIWDGVDVAGATFQEFVGDVYRDNHLATNRFDLDGQRVDLGEITVPLLQIVGEYDHIVPASSSTPLHDLVGSTDDRLIEFPAGHIGISVSSSAHDRLWPEVTDWLAARSADERAGGREQSSSEPTERPSSGPDEAVAEAARRAVDAAATEAAAAQTDAAAAERAETDGSGGLETVDGIGPTYAGRLEAAGIHTRADLAAHDAEDLAAIAETAVSRVRDWLVQVQD